MSDEAIRALKKCPFCGSEAHFRHIFENPDKCMVGCRGCDAVLDAVFPNEREAAKEWNGQKLADDVSRLESELAAMTASRDALSTRVTYECGAKNAFDIRWQVENRKYNKSVVHLQRARGQRDALKWQLAAMTRRAECAISDLARAGLCENCKHADSDECSETCGDSDSAYRWEWRGPKRNGTEDNTNATTTSPSAR